MTRKKYSYLFLAAIIACIVITSCKDDAVKPDYTANKAQLKQLTDSVNQAYANSAEGHGLGQYPKQARADLKEALDLAAVVNNGNHTQEEVNNAFSNLRRAVTAFNGRAISEVAVENLVAKWLFAGNAMDATANHHDGQLMSGFIAGHVDGGTLPVLTTDRFGQQGNAYEFANGAYIEVPYTTALNPGMISISLWVKPKESFGDNYMISLNRWNGFKFQLQSDNFLFMTVKTDAATYDKDSNPGKMVNGEWHHAVVTTGNGAITFYVDGAMVKTESLAGTAAKLATPVNLVIGQQLPKDSDPANFSSGAFFKGALDDIRYYNKVLSSAEVMQIYNNEKPD
jgi:hypothetical protein